MLDVDCLYRSKVSSVPVALPFDRRIRRNLGEERATPIYNSADDPNG